MTRHSQTLQNLHDMGCRLTPQRLFILSALAEGDDHIGVDEVFRRAKRSYPYMDIATVYRTLGLFKKLGVVTEVGMGDRLRYELTDPNGRHHHMVCRVCGEASGLDLQYMDQFRKVLMENFGFEPDLDNFTVTGVCAKCASNNSNM